MLSLQALQTDLAERNGETATQTADMVAVEGNITWVVIRGDARSPAIKPSNGTRTPYRAEWSEV